MSTPASVSPEQRAGARGGPAARVAAVTQDTFETRLARLHAQRHAEEFRGYIERHNARHPEHKATVRRLARRFRLRQAAIAQYIEGAPDVGLVVSEMAYLPPKSTDGAQIMFATFVPQYAPDAPLGDRLVVYIGDLSDADD